MEVDVRAISPESSKNFRSCWNARAKRLRYGALIIAEAYPATVAATDGREDEHSYHGPLSMYLSQSFTLCRRLKEMAVVRKAFR